MDSENYQIVCNIHNILKEKFPSHSFSLTNKIIIFHSNFYVFSTTNGIIFRNRCIATDDNEDQFEIYYEFSNPKFPNNLIHKCKQWLI